MEEAARSQLTSTLERLAARQASGRYWVGPKPTKGSTIAMIAAHVGLDAHGREADFHQLCVTDAALWLTLFATQSLLHGGQPIPAGIQREISDCFRDIGAEFLFFSKGVWQQTRRFKHYKLVSAKDGFSPRRHRLLFQDGSEPLSPISVLTDGGIVGFDNDTAFIFWVDEDN